MDHVSVTCHQLPPNSCTSVAACTNGGKTYVDGSIYNDTFGGAGILREYLTNEAPSQSFMCPVASADAQQAELTAIEKATELILGNIIKPQNKEYIFCDCKNAVNYVQNAFARPLKYRKTIQRIQENHLHLRKMGIEVTVHWIPGHADIDGNEQVDLVAKGAARIGRASGQKFSNDIWTENGFSGPPTELERVEISNLM